MIDEIGAAGQNPMQRVYPDIIRSRKVEIEDLLKGSPEYFKEAVWLYVARINDIELANEPTVLQIRRMIFNNKDALRTLITIAAIRTSQQRDECARKVSMPLYVVEIANQLGVDVGFVTRSLERLGYSRGFDIRDSFQDAVIAQILGAISRIRKKKGDENAVVSVQEISEELLGQLSYRTLIRRIKFAARSMGVSPKDIGVIMRDKRQWKNRSPLYD